MKRKGKGRERIKNFGKKRREVEKVNEEVVT